MSIVSKKLLTWIELVNIHTGKYQRIMQKFPYCVRGFRI